MATRRTTLRFPTQPHLKLDPGCVVSSCPIASSMGARVLYGGGNAIDAAVATALALGITYPQAGNIGGGGFMLVHTPDGGVHMLDYRERAPAGVDPALYDDEGNDIAKSSFGALAVAVPGTIAGLAEAHAKFGTRPWSEILGLIIPLAEHGVWLTTRQASSLRLYHETLKRFETTSRYFLRDGAPPHPGILFQQRDLASTLQAIAEGGPAAFYQGPTADRIVAQIKQLGGVLDHEDLASYKPVWREPLRRRFRDHDVYLPTLPSAGGLVTAVALGSVEAIDAETVPYGSPEWVLTWKRVFRAAFGFANQAASDPDALDPAALAEIRRMAEDPISRADFEQLEADLASKETAAGDAAAATRPSTTHFCVIDRDGMAVSNTYSVNTLFGSKLAVDGAGFLLNNTIADFRIAAGPNWYGLLQGEHNRLAKCRRPASSMTPCMVLANGLITLVIGGSGGPRIPTSLAQVVASVLGGGLSLGEAVRRPRTHHQLFPDDVIVEKGTPDGTIKALADRGEQVAIVNALGMVAAIRRRIDDNEISAVLDPRFGDFW